MMEKWREREREQLCLMKAILQVICTLGKGFKPVTNNAWNQCDMPHFILKMNEYENCAIHLWAKGMAIISLMESFYGIHHFAQ